MPNQNITMRQLMALLFTGLLSPAVRVLPGATAALGGRAGWLSTLLALPLALGLCWVLSALFRRLPPGTGLGEACRPGEEVFLLRRGRLQRRNTEIQEAGGLACQSARGIRAIL